MEDEVDRILAFLMLQSPPSPKNIKMRHWLSVLETAIRGAKPVIPQLTGLLVTIVQQGEA